ncbi:VRR-NUC domain-containing protein [Halomonas sp. ANAO-440]|uniref:VRR-NUC domain-containing protein n=1 Tax=Halomonas sp. ANAO-440 TaxID=2861360 RepID=UPI001CAA5130|nr:VRR-NUC domain-containing protein [Halomonas sp. ANAO-440]MBZ0332278.1 VRR-NUC domain-containing protein [Halomonas sp. ANAO-440]
MNSVLPVAPVTASLDDPFYYLANFRFVLGWVSERHDDLLGDGERRFIADFDALPRASQALLVRMVMRKGEFFRTTKLVYAEIDDAPVALDALIDAGWVEADPVLSLGELFRQLRLAELRRVLATEIAAACLPASAAKSTLYQALSGQPEGARRLANWGDVAALQGERVVRLSIMAICDRLRLMFFGNLRQDWSEFVLAELGLQRFERVAFSPESRAFSSRDEVDAYLALHRLRERLEEGELPEALHAEVPTVPKGNAWLGERRARLLYRLGQAAERGGQQALALQVYGEADSGGDGGGGHVDARIRRLRLLERLGEHQRAFELASVMVSRKEALGETLDAQAPDERESQALERLLPRLRRRLGLAPEPQQAPPPPERWDLCLRRPVSDEGWPLGVERAVCAHLGTPQAPVHYVENALITGLFGLLCWPAIFAPLPGAFFHPFHSGPADLNRADFVSRRRERFAACLAQLDDGRYHETILETWQCKRGLASPFLHWEALDEALLLQALANIPAAHLRACFARLLLDPRANRAGLPDLIQFLPEADVASPAYRLIEVKGPGDRLQDNQRRWLAYFRAHGIPAVVCHVTWQDEAVGS